MPDNPSEREIRNDAFIRELIDTFEQKDPAALEPYFAEDIRFENLGDSEIRGRSELLHLWAGVFSNFSHVKFETLHQSVSGDVVIAEQVHGLGLPGRPPAAIKNMAIYEIRDGKVARWRDYTNPHLAGRLLGL
jgi:limonene-1,2-epoxide hydrolase